MSSSYKQVIVVPKDIRLSAGKLAAQVAHASVINVMKMSGSRNRNYETLIDWAATGMTKVVLEVPTTIDLIKVLHNAQGMDLVTCVVRDAGRTEVEPGTVTCIGIGPAREEDINKITGELRLYGEG